MAKTAKKRKVVAKLNGALGIDDLAKALKLKPATVRAKLRKAKVRRTGRDYAFSSVTELNKVASRLSA